MTKEPDLFDSLDYGNPADWVGCLCWMADKIDKLHQTKEPKILKEYVPDSPFPFITAGGSVYKYARPVRSDEVKFYNAKETK